MLRVVLEGRETCEIDGRRLALEAGRMMLIPPGRPMILTAAPGTRSVSLELSPGDLDHPALGGTVLLPLASHPVGEWLEQLGHRMQSDDFDGRSAAAEALAHLSERLRELALDCRQRTEGLAASRERTRLDLLGRVDAARTLLDANPHRHVARWELERAARLSGFHLDRAFRQVCGVSPAAYHRGSRMEKAAALLRAGHSATQITGLLGFASPASFTRAFTRHHGCPPARFAKAACPK